MNLPSSTKTEQRAVNALENITDEHLTMGHQFNGNDKEMSWDGYIWLFKNNDGNQSKENLDARVPVQIKGHHDTKKRFYDKKRITYPVELDDLRAYAKEKGVLYFQIFVDGKNRKEIYYSSLFPSKISDYLERAVGKSNVKSSNIPFIKLEGNADTLYVVAKQFSEEATKQGSAYNPLVVDRIRSIDFDKLKKISLSVVGANDEYSALLRLSSGDVCLYGQMEDDKYPRPLQWVDESKFFVRKDVRQSVSLGDKVYYDKYKCIADSEGGMTLLLSPNLELRITEGKVNFLVKSSIEELYHDATFLLHLRNSEFLCIQGQRTNYLNPSMSSELEEKLEFFVDLYETLVMIGFDTSVKYSDLSESERLQLIELVNLRIGAYNYRLKEEISRYDWKYGDRYVPLLVIKENESITLESAIYTDRYAIFLPDENDEKTKENRMPLFVCHKENVLGNLLVNDFHAFRKQIDDCNYNEKTGSALLEGVLRIINVYDMNGQEEFLDLANYLLDKITPYVPRAFSILNSMQIKARRTGLDSNDMEVIQALEVDDVQLEFGKEVLLGEKEKAQVTFEKFPAEGQEQYKKFPIYTLFMRL